MKLRNPIGQWREARIFERRFKLPKVLIKIVVVLYAGIGLGTIGLTLKAESVKMFHEITRAKTTVIYPKNDQPAPEAEQPVEDIDVHDCLSALDHWTKEYGIEGQKETLKKLIEAESGNNNLAENGSSTATGCSQFVIGTWKSQGKKYWDEGFYEKNIYNPSDNVELLVMMIADNPANISHWDASKPSWQ